MVENINELVTETERLNKENAALQQQLREARESIEAIKAGGIDALVIAGKKDLKVLTETTADKTYRILIEKMHEGAVTLNADGTILYCNSYFATMVNLPLQKVTGTNFNQFIGETSKERIENLFKNDRETILKEEDYLHTRDGKKLPVLVTANTFRLDKTVVLSIILTDLTVQKKNEEELLLKTSQLEQKNIELEHKNKQLAYQSEEKEKRAAELTIANKELLYQHDEKEKRAAELAIANKELVFQNEEKEKRASDLIVLSADLKVQQQELIRANHLLIRQEEKVKIVNQELLQLNQELEERVAKRTRSLEESEIRFRNMMETIPQIAWTNTVEGEFTFYNRRWYDYTGLDQEQTKAWGFKTVIHPDDLKDTLYQYRLIQKSHVGGEFQIRGRQAEGAYRWHLVRLMPIKLEEQEVQLWVGTATDIHELKLLQQQKDDFISIASHELKTPLTSLKASMQLLNRMKDSPSATMLPNLILQANKSLDKVSTLIHDLLNASKVNKGQLHINKKLFIVSKIMDDCYHHIRAEGIYTIKVAGDLDVEVFADPLRIEQVLVNFVNNALKYAPGSKEILIHIEQANDMAKISVMDKGPGISPEKLPHLFDRYYRVDSYGSQYSGLGLGLYISSEIIKRHNGQIGVDSELGKGSTFWFTLPLAQLA